MNRACPKCGRELTSKLDPLLSHRCASCGGLWIREATFLSFVRKCLPGVPEGMISLQEKTAGATRLACPDCETVTLERVKLRAVEVERCGRCRRLFLDPGDAGLIVRRVRLAVKQFREKRHPSRTPRPQRILSSPLH